jgi:hypothetical protein
VFSAHDLSALFIPDPFLKYFPPWIIILQNFLATFLTCGLVFSFLAWITVESARKWARPDLITLAPRLIYKRIWVIALISGVSCAAAFGLYPNAIREFFVQVYGLSAIAYLGAISWFERRQRSLAS